MSDQPKPALRRWFAAAGVAVTLALAGWYLLLDSPLDRASYDWTFPLATDSQMPTNLPVVLVYLDQESYQRTGQNINEPWSRSLHAQLVDRLSRAGARAVVFDVIFGESGADPAKDAAFAEAIRRNGRVILGAEIESSGRGTAGKEGLKSFRVNLPEPRFRDAAAGWGITKFIIDDDLAVRRLFAGILSEGQPSLAWETAKLLKIQAIDDAELKTGHGWLRYYGLPLAITHRSIVEALDPKAVSDEVFRDKIVMIGARPIAGGFNERKDEFKSPIRSWNERDAIMPAVEIHATALCNLIRNDWLRRLPEGVEEILINASGIIFALLFFRFRPLTAGAIAVLAELGLLATVYAAFDAERVWFPWLIVSAVQIPGALLSSVLFQSVEWYYTRRRLEAERREAEIRIREQAALIDKAQDAILVQDLRGEIIYANSSAERLYGWTATDLKQNGAMKQLFAPAESKLSDARRTALEKGEWQGELGQATRAGQQLIVESRWTLIRNESGSPKSILLINTDITEKKRLEAQFLRAQRMDTIGSIAGGMAHDLNNALSPILMGIQLIGRKPQDDETRRMLTIMETNTHRGADMVRQVLTFSRGREGELELLNPDRLVREMENIIRQTLPQSIHVAAMVPNDLWPVRANSTQLHQVLLNLCVNARDAMPNGGELSLAVDNVELSATEATTLPGAVADQYVMLMVSDTGTGIPPEVLPHIFDPFFTTKEPGKGTGLGLATIARIVRGHGGFVSVKSEVGVGTSFEVYLPRVQATPGIAAAVIAESQPTGHGELILFVDNERSLREMAGKSLADHGYRVVFAANGIEALQLLNEQPRDVKLVLTDFDMPIMNGKALVEALRASRPDLPVILMSGELDLTTQAETAFLRKPFGLEQLLAAISKGLKQKPDKS